MCADTHPLHRQRGLSMIELMVGLTVALIVGLAATNSAVMFNASQRQGIGVGGVAVNVNTALAALKNDAATAGLGFFGNGRYLCASLNLSRGTTAHSNGAAFVPVRVNQVSGRDEVDVIQSARVESGATVLLQTSSTGASARLKSYMPAAVGQAVLLSPATAVSSQPCLVRTVTAVTAATATTPQELTFAAGGLHNDGTFTTAVTYPESTGGVTLLGDLRWTRYKRTGTNLVVERPLMGDSAVLARNVIAFRAQYGLSSASDPNSKTLESWTDATGAFATLNETTIARVRAVRVGVVTRSPQREKPNAMGNCEATAVMPKVFPEDTVTATSDVTDWQCYRYARAVLVIPLRNLVVGM